MREHKPGDRVTTAGSLLLAHPRLRDPNFRRAVILMTAHNADGALGVILNRPLGRKLGDLGGDFALGRLSGVPIFQGGPVKTEHMILAVWRMPPGGFQLHFGINPETANQLPVEEGAELRAFSGYSGWGAGQLEKEMKLSTWVVAAPPTDLFARAVDASLWRDVLAQEGPEWRLFADEPDEAGEN
jgi:putative transcriptional regulator